MRAAFLASFVLMVSATAALANEREEALWLTRFTAAAERMVIVALKQQDSLALETNAVLLDVAIEQAGLNTEGKFRVCGWSAVALHNLTIHLLTSRGDMRPVLLDRVFRAYSESTPECETLVGEAGPRMLSLPDLLSFPAPDPAVLTQLDR